MRAAGVTEFGGPEALQIVDVPAEPLGPGEVRLRVAAATVNPTDTHARAGAYAERDPVKSPPWVPGMDVAGVVVRGRARASSTWPSGTLVDGHRRPDRRARRLPGGHRAARRLGGAARPTVPTRSRPRRCR